MPRPSGNHRTYCRKYFKDEDPIGKILILYLERMIKYRAK